MLGFLEAMTMSKKVGDSGLGAEAAETKVSIILQTVTARVVLEAQQAVDTG